MNQLQAISFSHETAALAWREALQLNPIEASQLIQHLLSRPEIEGVLVLTTCNRTEIYFEASEPATLLVQNELLEYKNITNAEEFAPLFRHFTSSTQTLTYLLEVGLGLRSQVIGDRQIIGQIKESYTQSQNEQAASPLLHQALQTLFRTHKRVHNETNFRSGASSIGYAALERIADFIPRKEFSSKRLLILGTGQMGKDVAKYALSFGFADVTLTNRTDTTAQEIAEQLNLNYLPYAEQEAKLPEFDIIISCVRGGEQLFPHPFATHAWERKRVLVDLSVPQSISPAVGRLPRTVLINLDQITTRTEAVQQMRRASIIEVRKIMQEETAVFTEWLEHLPVAHSISQLKALLADILTTELQKHAPLQTESAAEAIAEAAIKRLLRKPAGTLRTAAPEDREKLLEALHTLFQLPTFLQNAAA